MKRKTQQLSLTLLNKLNFPFSILFPTTLASERVNRHPRWASTFESFYIAKHCCWGGYKKLTTSLNKDLIGRYNRLWRQYTVWLKFSVNPRGIVPSTGLGDTIAEPHCPHTNICFNLLYKNTKTIKVYDTHFIIGIEILAEYVIDLKYDRYSISSCLNGYAMVSWTESFLTL